ncbi:MAG: class I SAM-dependent methyltransferase [Treponema sp.]|nr:class I SAM-dependent methyltransferase [Treponema sp.]
MENKLAYQSELFGNRLRKKYKELRKWARKNRITCYRLYDRDIPEIPVSLDLYEFLPSDISTPLECARFLSDQNNRLSANDPSVDAEIKERTYAVLYLYERPYEKSDEEEQEWMNAIADSACQVLGINKNHIIQKMRKHQKGKAQYEKEEISENTSLDSELIQEQGQLFKINLTSYLDTGLFFDHRPLRSVVRDECSNKSVLNLFCYTGSFSVYAAQGNARRVESVDLSNTYLDWAKENLKNNGFKDNSKYIFTRADCIEYLKQKALAAKSGELKKTDYYDLIILDPPTFSNSKNTFNVLDINKDWPQLVKDCTNILTPGGTLYFSTNSERLKFDPSQLPQVTIGGQKIQTTDITAQTIPNDYVGTKCHRCWKITVAN